MLMCLPACLVVTSLAASMAGDPPTPATPAAPNRTSLALSLAALQAAEGGSITLDLARTHVDQACEALGAAGHLPLRIDWDALADLGIAKDDTIDFRIQDVPALVALKALAATMNAEIEAPVVDASAGQLILTSPRGLAKYRETAIYEIGDILADPLLIDAVAAKARAAAETKAMEEASKGGNDEPAPSPADDSDATTTSAGSPGAATVAFSPLTARAERLVDLIADHVDSEGWEDNGGSRSRLSHEAGRLIVSATPETHRQLRAFLAELRNGSPTSATTTWTIGVMPSGALDTLLATSDDPAAQIAAVKAASQFRVLGTPRVSVRLGDEATTEVDDGRNSIRCTANVSFDRARGTLALATSVAMGFGPAKAAIQSTLTGTARRAAGVLRLPSGPSAGEAWVVLTESFADPRPAPRDPATDAPTG